MTIVSTRTGAALAVSALLLAGCGAAESPRPAPPAVPSAAGSATPAASASPAAPAEEQALAQARIALQNARSYVFKGSRAFDNVKATGQFRMVDGNTAGTIRVLGRSAEFRTIGKELYLLPGEDYWPFVVGAARAAKAEREAAGRWIRMSVYNQSVSQFFGVPVLLADLRPTGTLIKGKVSGTGADSWVNLTSRTDPKWRAGILTTGKRHPRYWTTATSNATITEFDAALPVIKRPAKADVVTYDELSD